MTPREGLRLAFGIVKSADSARSAESAKSTKSVRSTREGSP